MTKQKVQIEAVRKELERLLRFETLLADLSARFVNLPSDEIDGNIMDAQRHLCEFLDLDRSSLVQVSEAEHGAMRFTHVNQPPGGQPVPGPMRRATSGRCSA